jgi:hypothetical protein
MARNEFSLFSCVDSFYRNKRAQFCLGQLAWRHLTRGAKLQRHVEPMPAGSDGTTIMAVDNIEFNCNVC